MGSRHDRGQYDVAPAPRKIARLAKDGDILFAFLCTNWHDRQLRQLCRRAGEIPSGTHIQKV